MKRGAFSLVELMIVIVIMGVVYTLSVTNFPTKAEEEAGGLSLANLKEYLQNLTYEKSAELLCLDECQSCDILIDGEKNSTVENFVDDTIEAYRYDYRLGPQEVVPNVYFNKEGVQENICFSFKVDKEGVGDQILVKYKKRVYDFSTYILPTEVYFSLEDAVASKEKLIEEVLK